MKHLIILFLLTLPLIACKSLNNLPPEPPGDSGQKADEGQETPGRKDDVRVRAIIAKLDKIIEWDSRNTKSDDQYVTHTFTKTYPDDTPTDLFKKHYFAVEICKNKLNPEIENLINRYGARSPVVESVDQGKYHVSYKNKANSKIRADCSVFLTTLNMTLTLPKGTQ